MTTFSLFSLEHFLYLGGYLVLTLILFFLSSFSYKKSSLAKVSVFIILALKISELFYRYTFFHEDILEMLPLHLCNLALITAIIAMTFKSYFFFELTYFWSGGAIFALLTPEVKYSFPNLWNISFFATHFYLLYAVLYCINYFNFKPTKSGLYKSIITINILALFIYQINKVIGTNYMFINHIPKFESPINFLGPWPYYIISFEAIALLLFYALYLPFRKRKPSFTTYK